jgi:hypothetical protein
MLANGHQNHERGLNEVRQNMNSLATHVNKLESMFVDGVNFLADSMSNQQSMNSRSQVYMVPDPRRASSSSNDVMTSVNNQHFAYNVGNSQGFGNGNSMNNQNQRSYNDPNSYNVFRFNANNAHK